ncbi:hypothetical protein HU200_042698 [Digitaria exilis]|uniref:Uncharacterized protein n=1 Tax=Digitaria exilis TaxID=1010633 RepID=A0A835B5I6_9POAL|nr:hypothetical protein HU200_042698 [Digitaria exilis]
MAAHAALPAVARPMPPLGTRPSACALKWDMDVHQGAWLVQAGSRDRQYEGAMRAYGGVAGTVELSLRNVVHRWTRDLLLPNNEDMGAYYYFAYDPILYPQHVNSERKLYI